MACGVRLTFSHKLGGSLFFYIAVALQANLCGKELQIKETVWSPDPCLPPFRRDEQVFLRNSFISGRLFSLSIWQTLPITRRVGVPPSESLLQSEGLRESGGDPCRPFFASCLRLLGNSIDVAVVPGTSRFRFDSAGSQETISFSGF
jgi:hypothetical protein